MGRPISIGKDSLKWDHQSRMTQYGDNTFTYNLSGVRDSKNKIRYALSGNKILAEINSEGKIRIKYIYALEKLIGFEYNNRYFYERNIQGDILKIYQISDKSSVLVAEYIYDAWGNHKVINHTSENIGDINPFRYRGYYFDSETGLYYLNSRYYSSEMGRFISPDEFSILDETKAQINGLNLYMYCMDNPIMMTDDNGFAPKWWNPFRWFDNVGNVGKIIIGAVAFGAAVGLTILTGGAVAPLLIGMATGVASSTLFGGIGAVISSGGDWSKFGEGAWNGFADGVLWGGIFAFSGAAIRGVKYATAVKNKDYNSLAKLFTHNKLSKKVMLGKYDGGGPTSYIAKAGHSHTYFNMPSRIFRKLAAKYGDDVWQINQAFLNQQIGKTFCFSHPIATATGYFKREIDFLIELGIL